MSGTDPAELLDEVVRGRDSDMWADTGRAGLLVLREELSKRWGWGDRWRDVYPTQRIDGLNEASAAIAARWPNEFLEVFANRRFDRDEFVLCGLGQIDDERATERLARASTARGLFSSFTRKWAAIGLGRRPSDLATDALLRLLRDRDYLVRAHTYESLGAIGDRRALQALAEFRAPSTREQEFANDARALIEQRLAGT